ncbi:CUB and zona pellucida-like domain-containing protein 1 [Engraulis encrasicolus]|uniref:CUB and zona pellucida-like domain-containing protein 1 n=1 Tax=Engraulis encrasicolus TaxID=184585 RepID=UPI002FD4C716
MTQHFHWTYLKDCYPNGTIDYVNLNTSSNINVPGRWVIPASFDFSFSCSYPDEPTATPLPQGDKPTVTPQQQQDEPVTHQPQQAYIGNVICSESFMAIEVNKTQSEEIRIHEDHLRLNDPSCTLYSNGTHVFANMSLNTCGTVMEEDATNMIFKNEIVSVDNPNDIITRHHLVKIEFFCKYPKKSNVILEFNVHRNPYTFIQKGFGTFSYQFEFFQSSQFRNLQDPSSYPLEYDLGEMMYMQIEGISPVNNTELFVESCKASPSDDPNAHVSYSIISDGCNQDETVQFYSSHGNVVRFGMKAFKFIGLHDQVFITCSVILCEAGNPNTRCSQGCSNTTAAPAVHHHHRREASAAPIQTLRHYISQGPLRLRRSTNMRDATSTVATDGLNMNLVFVVGCLLAAVSVLSGVLFYTKRAKVVYQPLPSFDGE